MSNISTFSTVAGNNNSSPPNGWPEGMARSAVNDTARELYSALAKWYKDTQGTLLSTNTSTAYNLTTNNAHASLSAQSIVSFRAHVACGASPTLNVDGLGAKAIHKTPGVAVQANDIPINSIVVVQYNPNLDRYEMLSSAVALGDASIATAKYAAGSVDATALGTNAVTSVKINALAVTAGKIAVDAVTASEIAAGAVGASELATDAVTTVKILNANVTTAKLATGAVTANELGTDAVTTVKILDANVTNAKLATNAVTTIKITDANVTTAKIADDNVTYAKIQNVSVTDRLLGRDTAGAGDIEELTVNGPLVFTGSVGIDISLATTSAYGSVELATDAETVTGTDTARVAPVSSMVRHEGVAKVWAM